MRSSMPTMLNHAAIDAVNSKIYIIGGQLGSAFIFTASNTNVVEEYDPTTDQWGLVKARMPTERGRGPGVSTTVTSGGWREHQYAILWRRFAPWKSMIRRRTVERNCP
jgi:Kelch motif